MSFEIGGAMKRHPFDDAAKPNGITRREALFRLGGVASVMALPGGLRTRDPLDAFERSRSIPVAPALKEEGMPRALHAAALLDDRRLMLTGGYYDGPLSSVEIYEPESGIWRDAASLNTPRYHHAATRLNDGRVLVVGGYFTGPLSGAEVYDPYADAWTDAAPLDSPRYQHAAVTLPTGHVIVTGGSFNAALSGAAVYDPVADRWEAL
jgi:hypothetical protein